MAAIGRWLIKEGTNLNLFMLKSGFQPFGLMFLLKSSISKCTSYSFMLIFTAVMSHIRFIVHDITFKNPKNVPVAWLLHILSLQTETHQLIVNIYYSVINLQQAHYVQWKNAVKWVLGERCLFISEYRDVLMLFLTLR